MAHKEEGCLTAKSVIGFNSLALLFNLKIIVHENEEVVVAQVVEHWHSVWTGQV